MANLLGRGASCTRTLLLILLLLLIGCAPVPVLSRPDPVPVPAFAQTGEGRIYWVNEIGKGRDAVSRAGLASTLQEILIGKESVQLGRPHSVHVDGRGRIFVSEPEAHRVHLFDPKNSAYRVIRADRRQDLISPLGIASDDDGNLYVTDSASGHIYRYAVDRERLERFGPRLSRPTGIAFDRYLSRLYVVDTQTHQVVVLDRSGKELGRIGSRGEREGEFNCPTDVAVDRDGRVLVNDALNARIQIFRPDRSFVLSFGSLGTALGNFVRAKGIATDSRGDIYVSDSMTDTVQVFDCKGKHQASFGTTGNAPGEFWMPSGICIDKADRLYVVDAYNARVQVFQGLDIARRENRSDLP